MGATFPVDPRLNSRMLGAPWKVPLGVLISCARVADVDVALWASSGDTAYIVDRRGVTAKDAGGRNVSRGSGAEDEDGIRLRDLGACDVDVAGGVDRDLLWVKEGCEIAGDDTSWSRVTAGGGGKDGEAGVDSVGRTGAYDDIGGDVEVS